MEKPVAGSLQKFSNLPEISCLQVMKSKLTIKP